MQFSELFQYQLIIAKCRFVSVLAEESEGDSPSIIEVLHCREQWASSTLLYFTFHLSLSILVFLRIIFLSCQDVVGGCRRGD